MRGGDESRLREAANQHETNVEVLSSFDLASLGRERASMSERRGSAKRIKGAYQRRLMYVMRRDVGTVRRSVPC